MSRICAERETPCARLLPRTRPDQDTAYAYDGLDRRDKRTEAGTDYEYTYIGLSEKLAREEDAGLAHSKSYDYDSQLRRQGQQTTKLDQTAKYRPYAFDANGSVEGLEADDGSFREPGAAKDDRYRYDPYGQLDTDSADPEDDLGDDAKENPFRYQGFYYDSGVKTYDMQARQYRPDINRFLTQDRYESAAGDLDLQTDPLTQNRYAFAGGNPVNNIEFDGHFPGYNDQTPKSRKRVYRTNNKGYCSDCQRITPSKSDSGQTSSAPQPKPRVVAAMAPSPTGTPGSSCRALGALCSIGGAISDGGEAAAGFANEVAKKTADNITGAATATVEHAKACNAFTGTPFSSECLQANSPLAVAEGIEQTFRGDAKQITANIITAALVTKGAATTLKWAPRKATKGDVGLASRGLRPAAGTRVRPDGVPEGWRIRGTKTGGGTRYYDPSNPGNSLRVMQGNPKSPYPSSQAPYVRWQRNGQPLDANGNVLPSANSPDAHVPLSRFRFRSDLFE